MSVRCPMSKTLQITVTDETAQQIKALTAITGHERPGALINLLVRRYGQDLAQCMSGDVLTSQDVRVQPSPVASLPTPVNVPLPHEDVLTSQDVDTTSQYLSPGNAFLAMDFA
jgi:hypothetical protein